MTKKTPCASPFAPLEALKARMQAEEAKNPAAKTASQSSTKALKAKDIPKRPTVEVWRPENFDQHLFDVAMAGVRPLQAAARRVSGHGGGSPERASGVETRMKRSLAAGGPELEVRWNPDGTVSAARPGRHFAVEALGRFTEPDETLDLHGMDTVTAQARVAEFVRTRRARGQRCVSVVHGRGARSPDGTGVLLDAVVAALKVAPSANELDGFATAPDALGGLGALLIALREAPQSAR